MSKELTITDSDLTSRLASCFVTNSLYWSCPFLSRVFANRMHLVNLLFFLLIFILLYYLLFIKKVQLFIDSIRSIQRSTLSPPFQYIALSRQTPSLPNAVLFKIFGLAFTSYGEPIPVFTTTSDCYNSPQVSLGFKAFRE